MNFQPFEIEHFFRQHEFSAPFQISPSDCEPLTLPFDGPSGRFFRDQLTLAW